MMDDLRISNLRFTPAGPHDRQSGLLGWVALDLGDALHIDGVTVRRTRDGRLALSWPARRDSTGHLHHHIKPLNDRVRRHLEQQVFTLLGQEVTP